MPLSPKHLLTPPVSQTCSAKVLDLREKIRELDYRARQSKLDDSTARRLELRRVKERVKEQLEAVCGEKSRLDSLATIEEARDLWRLQDKARAIKRREQNRLQDEAGIRARGSSHCNSI
jgi:hypothetical protein